MGLFQLKILYNISQNSIARVVFPSEICGIMGLKPPGMRVCVQHTCTLKQAKKPVKEEAGKAST